MLLFKLHFSLTAAEACLIACNVTVNAVFVDLQ